MAKEEKDLKTEEGTSESLGQDETKSLDEELSLDAKAEEESVDSLPEWAKERLTKAERDRDNYKEGLLKSKKEPEKEEIEEKEEPSVEDVATQVVTKTLERNNEKEGINQFISKYSALREPSRWKQVLANLPANVDKSSVAGVMTALEIALNTTNFVAGKKIEDTQVDLSDMTTVSGTRSKAEVKDTPGVKESTIEMGNQFKHNVEDLAKEDDSLHAEIVI